MKYILRATIFIICLISMMSSIASAEVVNNLPYDTRNLPLDSSYAFFDFENGIGHFEPIPISQYNSAINFVTVFNNNRDHVWSYDDAEHSLMHVYPQNVFFQDDGVTPVNYTYLINGRYAASTVVELYIGGFYTGVYGLIEIPEGANHVSFLVSSGDFFKASIFDKRGNQIDYTSVPTTIYRISLPNGPSTWSLVSFNRSSSDIYSVVVEGQCNDWLMDDLLIGGLTIPERPTNYTYAAERMKELIGVKFLKEGTGYNYFIDEYYRSQEIIDGGILYWNKYTKEVKIGNGIYDEDAILWAFNVNDDLINWKNINKMAYNDFKIGVKYGEQQPGDVFFLDYDGNGHYNEVGIFIEPMVDDTGDMVDIIRIIPDAGVHYSTAEFIHALYGEDIGIGVSSSMDCKRLPDNPKGGHSPYPKIPTKFFI